MALLRNACAVLRRRASHRNSSTSSSIWHSALPAIGLRPSQMPFPDGSTPAPTSRMCLQSRVRPLTPWRAGCSDTQRSSEPSAHRSVDFKICGEIAVIEPGRKKTVTMTDGALATVRNLEDLRLLNTITVPEILKRSGATGSSDLEIIRPADVSDQADLGRLPSQPLLRERA
jgi:hypothetical protein